MWWILSGSVLCTVVMLHQVGWSVNWARRMGLFDNGKAFPQLAAYTAKLLAMRHCPFDKE